MDVDGAAAERAVDAMVADRDRPVRGLRAADRQRERVLAATAHPHPAEDLDAVQLDAVGLELRVAAAQGGEIFVLDMGEPVRIIDLARDMIRLSGLEPDRDIAIEVVGIRPGEKLDEDLFEEWETVAPTAHAKVRRATRPTIDAAWLELRLDSLEELALGGDTLRAEELLLQMVRAPQRAGSPALDRAQTT